MHPAFGTRTVEYNPKIIFTVNILEALDHKITISLIERYLGSLFTSNPKYADDNAETGGDRPVPVPRFDREWLFGRRVGPQGVRAVTMMLRPELAAGIEQPGHRHRLIELGDIISESVGDFVGICSGCKSKRLTLGSEGYSRPKAVDRMPRELDPATAVWNAQKILLCGSWSSLSRDGKTVGVYVWTHSE